MVSGAHGGAVGETLGGEKAEVGGVAKVLERDERAERRLLGEDCDGCCCCKVGAEEDTKDEVVNVASVAVEPAVT